MAPTPSNVWSTDRSRSTSGVRGGGGNKSNNASNAGSGTATPTTTTSSTTLASGQQAQGSGPSTSSGMHEEHVPVGGFNSSEAKDWLRKCFTDALAGDSAKAAQYNPSNGSGSGSSGGAKAGPWGSKPTVMANGQDYWVQLKKQVAAREAGGGG